MCAEAELGWKRCSAVRGRSKEPSSSEQRRGPTGTGRNSGRNEQRGAGGVLSTSGAPLAESRNIGQ